ADEREVGAEGQRGDDIGTVADAGVDDDLHVLADLTSHLGQQFERHWRTGEPTSAVVGQHDRVDAEVGELLRVLERLHALDGELAGPHGADLGEVVEVNGRVHRRVEQLADGPAGLGQGSELELRGGQEVPPPPRTGNRVEDRL